MDDAVKKTARSKKKCGVEFKINILSVLPSFSSSPHSCRRIYVRKENLWHSSEESESSWMILIKKLVIKPNLIVSSDRGAAETRSTFLMPLQESFAVEERISKYLD